MLLSERISNTVDMGMEQNMHNLVIDESKSVFMKLLLFHEQYMVHSLFQCDGSPLGVNTASTKR